MDEQGKIHDEHPFVTPIADREPARRFRGRLVAPVTIVTSGDEDERVGLTVSSLVVAEGDPPLIYMLVGSTTDLWYAIEETERFVVHVVEADDRGLADIFAGLRPSPGGPFVNVDTTHSDHGPIITHLQSRAFCTLVSSAEDSYSLLVAGAVDRSRSATSTIRSPTSVVPTACSSSDPQRPRANP